MSDRESQQASIDVSEASLPAENGSREVANDPPSLGRAEGSVSDAGVAARTRFQRRLQNVAGADIIDPARIADPPTRSDPPEASTSARAAESSAPTAASASLQGVATRAVPMPSSSPDLANVVEWLSLQTAAQAAAQAEAFRQLQLETERQLQEQRLTFQRALAESQRNMLEATRRELRAMRIASPVPSK